MWWYIAIAIYDSSTSVYIVMKMFIWYIKYNINIKVSYLGTRYRKYGNFYLLLDYQSQDGIINCNYNIYTMGFTSY